MASERKVVEDKTRFLVRRENRVVSVLSVLAVFAAWEILGRSGLVTPLFLPPFTAVLRSGLEMVQSGEILEHLAASLWRIGFLVLSAADLMQTPRLLFGILVLSLMGISFAWILEKLERRLVPWR
ncbi:MAG TPA: hypothetical protein HPP59_08210 [Deltaproteobacteria bacterium]|nr:hypothetical protein [Deltaproteobacteria bacterium]HIJ41439.1 hypothetical protein [Deltaproteobacteria bacterium]